MQEPADYSHHFEQLELAHAERIEANALSVRRQELAEPIGRLVSIPDQDLQLRAMSGLILVSSWYTDRQDGKKARRSVARAQAIAEVGITGISDHPITRYLTSDSTKAEGAAIDADSDKVMRNAIHEGLHKRAIRERDVVASVIMKFDLVSSRLRDQHMATVRDTGKVHGVDVKANWLGKLKTALQAGGSTLTATSRSGSIPHRIGLGAIAASHAPSWLAVLKMRSDIRRVRATKDL